MGGIPVARTKKQSLTEQLAEKAKNMDKFCLCITPEGTRQRTTEWKRGFYYIALKAGIPILLYGVDYKRKLIQCTKMVMPTGDFDNEIIEIKQYYKDFIGKKPENFTIDNE
jgi:1-acyl-sn-glycerol-3-phosphate acyltransferase